MSSGCTISSQFRANAENESEIKDEERRILVSDLIRAKKHNPEVKDRIDLAMLYVDADTTSAMMIDDMALTAPIIADTHKSKKLCH